MSFCLPIIWRGNRRDDDGGAVDGDGGDGWSRGAIVVIVVGLLCFFVSLQTTVLKLVFFLISIFFETQLGRRSHPMMSPSVAAVAVGLVTISIKHKTRTSLESGGSSSFPKP